MAWRVGSLMVMALVLLKGIGRPRGPVSQRRTGVICTPYISLAFTKSLVARLLQALIAGVLHVWLTWRISRRIFGETPALMAAGLSAIYIYFFYYAGSLITETFYIVGILWTFDIVLRLAGYDEPYPERATVGKQRLRWLELGCAIGVTALFRQLFLLFVPFLFLWLWWMLRWHDKQAEPGGTWPRITQLAGARSHWQGFLLAGLVIAALITPWTLRNYRAFGVLVPLNTNSGFAFFWGNHPIYGTEFVGILPDDGPSYYDLIPKELLPLNEAQLDQALLKRGLGFVTADPQRYILLSISRTREYFKFWPSPNSGLVSNLSRLGSFGLLLPFMLYGLGWSLVLSWRTSDTRQRAAILFLWLFMLVYTGIHLSTWALIRYRLPVDAFLLCFAALSLTQLTQRLAGERNYRG
jgi:Dolichyl-phosphate-mannose-protein mannosyltransferase